VRLVGGFLCLFAGITGFLCIISGIPTPPTILLFSVAGFLLIVFGRQDD
jgi:hypothetical protein